MFDAQITWHPSIVVFHVHVLCRCFAVGGVTSVQILMDLTRGVNRKITLVFRLINTYRGGMPLPEFRKQNVSVAMQCRDAGIQGTAYIG